MKKSFKMYFAIWAVTLAVFNIVAFFVRPLIMRYSIDGGFNARFWVIWAFVMIAFLGNLICAHIAFKAEDPKRLFYNIPLITISRAALIVMSIAGIAMALIPGCPAPAAAIVCVLILAFNLIGVIKAKWAADVVEEIDKKSEARSGEGIRDHRVKNDPKIGM